MEMKNIKEYFTKEDVSRLRVIIFIIGIVLIIFMETSIFGNLNDVFKVLIYAILFGVSMLLKIDFSGSREVGKQIMGIYKDKNLTWYEKGTRFGNIGMQLIHKAGELWELGMEEQFEDKPTLPKVDSDNIIYTNTDIEGLKKEE